MSIRLKAIISACKGYCYWENLCNCIIIVEPMALANYLKIIVVFFRLKEGDSGSFLYLAIEEQDKLPILGMFIGQYKYDERVHQAIILSQNIELAEETDELHIMDIKLPA